MMNPYTAVITTPFGHLGILVEAQTLTKIDFLHNVKKEIAAKDRITEKVIDELENYFENPQHRFKLKLKLEGTDHQKRVWNALREIPVGSFQEYGQLAKKLKSSARAIGNACRSNPIPIIIPCHRIIAKNGIGGYNGTTCFKKQLNIKYWLLKHEGCELEF